MRVVVCVTGQRSCERLILDGVERAKHLSAQLCVVHVVGMKAQLLGLSSESEAIAYLFTLARDHGAEVTILRNDNFLQAISAYTEKNETATIIMGGTPPGSRRDMGRELREMLPEIEVHVLPYLMGDLEAIDPPTTASGGKMCPSSGSRGAAFEGKEARGRASGTKKEPVKKSTAKKEPARRERKSRNS